MSLVSNVSRINHCISHFKYLERNKCLANHAIKQMHSIRRSKSQGNFTALEQCRTFWVNSNQYLTPIRLHSTCSILAAKKDTEKEYSSTKKQYDSPLITLIDRDDKTTVLSLSQAQRLSKRRNLKLVKIEDPTLQKQERPLYKLLTGKEYFDEQILKKDEMVKDASGVKGEKTILISGQIEKHDLESKMKNVIKWLKKSQRVKVTISAGKSNEDDRARVLKKMEEAVAPVGGRLLQVREKGDNIKFYIEPHKVTINDQESAL
ncbi:unnamed protein product [Meganyctiphanes norvegica]|uniref:Uncharacterized protein n=1 Tax=Meganyctiphanes norvegica TaxID=48144 RepID=A0AAV2QQT4_MEGNR